MRCAHQDVVPLSLGRWVRGVSQHTGQRQGQGRRICPLGWKEKQRVPPLHQGPLGTRGIGASGVRSKGLGKGPGVLAACAPESRTAGNGDRSSALLPDLMAGLAGPLGERRSEEPMPAPDGDAPRRGGDIELSHQCSRLVEESAMDAFGTARSRVGPRGLPDHPRSKIYTRL